MITQHGPARRRRSTAPWWVTCTLGLGVLLVLGGCGGAVAPALPAYTASASASASGTASGTASATLSATAHSLASSPGAPAAALPVPLPSGPGDPSARPAAAPPVTVAHLPLPGGLGPQQTRAAERYGAFYDALASASAAPEEARPQVAAVASGSARQGVESFAAAAAAKHWRYVGVLALTVTSSTVTGAAATVCGFYVDHSYPVDRAGREAESVDDAPQYVRGRLTRTGDTWTVTDNANGVSC